MTIYLDSALVDDARQAMALGFVRGITTNPNLMARTGRPAPDVVRELCTICPHRVFVQLTAPTVAARRAEGERFLQLNAELGFAAGVDLASFRGVGLKIPASTENMSLVDEFSRQGVVVAVTALFSLPQAYLAAEAGAAYLLPYVNRTTRLKGDGLAFVRDLARVCQAVGRGTEILAASIKSPDEAVQTLLAGAHHVSAPLAILQAMGNDPLSEAAVAEFARARATG